MKCNTVSESTGEQSPPILSLQSFCRQGGISPITAWRWRKLGWLETVNIAGRQYVTADGITQFTLRAAAGEFAKQHKIPQRQREVAA